MVVIFRFKELGSQKECFLKNTMKMKAIRKIVGVIALAAIIGFSLASCDGGGNNGPPSILPGLPNGTDPNGGQQAPASITTATGLTLVSTTGGWEVAGWSDTFQGDRTAVTIPATYGGYPIIAIAHDAFFVGQNLAGEVIGTQLTSVTFEGHNLVTIGSRAFWNNRLTTVTIPGNVNVIENQAFSSNELSNLTIHEGVTTIQAMAFQENQLVYVVIPNSVRTIESSVFERNYGLSTITIGSGVDVATGGGDLRHATFASFYNNQGRQAGVYTFGFVSGIGDWSFEPLGN